jgi:hypothetical protein
LLERSSNNAQALWLAALFELKIAAGIATETQRSQEMGLETLKPSKMNRLQRSLVSGRVSAVVKDSTIGVSKFLSNTLKNFTAHLETNVEAGQLWKVCAPNCLTFAKANIIAVREKALGFVATILVGHLQPIDLVIL